MPFSSWRALLGSFALVFPLFNMGCSKHESIPIGFVGSLTQFSTELSIQGRNGAIFAIEEINANGGIDGTPLSLTIRDIGKDPENCAKAIQELLASGHHYIIGPYTSNFASASVSAMRGKNAILITPTMTTDALEGLDDEILRLQPSNFWHAEQIARHVKSLGFDSAITIYDASNREYAETLVASFSKTFRSIGGKIQYLDSIVPRERSIQDVAKKIIPIQSQAIFISTTGSQMASFAQTLRVGKNETPLFSGAWGMTPEVLTQGGANIEGATFSALTPPASMNSTPSPFALKYKERFGTLPNFAATTSYEAIQALADAFKSAPLNQPAKVKAYLLSKEIFQGVYDTFRWNRFGDVMRKQTLVIVKDAQFQRLEME